MTKEFDFSSHIELENERAKLEPLTLHHLDMLIPIAVKNPDLLKFSPSPFGTEELLEDYIDKAIQQRKAQKRYAFAVFDKGQGTYAGSTSFGEVSNKDKRLQIGWTWLGRDFQRTGLNRNCKCLMLKFVFENLDFERVEFVTDSRNLASQKAIEGIGGKFEGELRSHVLMPDGYRRNTRYYSILRKEWPKIKAQLLKN